MKYGGIKLKKSYSKPTVAFQNMFLATTVNSACTFSASLAYDSCVTLIEDWGETIYNDDKCDISYEDAPCYHVPMESSNVFES